MNDIITGPLYHVPNCSSGPLLPYKAWWSNLPHWSRLPELTLMTFGALDACKLIHESFKSFNVSAGTVIVFQLML